MHAIEFMKRKRKRAKRKGREVASRGSRERRGGASRWGGQGKQGRYRVCVLWNPQNTTRHVFKNTVDITLLLYELRVPWGTSLDPDALVYWVDECMREGEQRCGLYGIHYLGIPYRRFPRSCRYLSAMSGGYGRVLAGYWHHGRGRKGRYGIRGMSGTLLRAVR